MTEKHIKGLIKKSKDGLSIGYNLLADLFADAVSSAEKSKQEDDKYLVNSSVFQPNVSLQVFACESKCSLDEAKTNLVKFMSGDLDVLTEWYGYSEYTIEGYSVENFTLGGHDLEKEFTSLVGKYVHFLLEVKD